MGQLHFSLLHQKSLTGVVFARAHVLRGKEQGTATATKRFIAQVTLFN